MTSVAIEESELLTTPQAAKYLGNTKNTLVQWRTMKVGPTYIKLGHAVRYSMDDLEKYKNERVRVVETGQRFIH